MKKQLLKISFFIFLLFCQIAVYGQLKNFYVKGTIELQNGQTLTGFIRDDVMADMNYRIRFKSTLADTSIYFYDTTQIKNFRLEDGEVYELLHFRGLYMKGDVSVLAKLIIRGKASLYSLVYNSDQLFIITNDGKLYVLQNDKLEGSSLALEEKQFYFKAALNNAVMGSDISNAKLEKVRFSERDFRAIITSYNKYAGSENNIVAFKKKPVRFIIASAGGMIKKADEREIYFQGIYRLYFPKISRRASMNVSLNYFNYKYKVVSNFPGNTSEILTNSLISLPFYGQYNFLDKKVRPYAFTGLNVSYLKISDEQGNSVLPKGFQKNFGIALLYGVGVEVDIYQGFMLKSEYRKENFAHLILVGMGYIFSMN